MSDATKLQFVTYVEKLTASFARKHAEQQYTKVFDIHAYARVRESMRSQRFVTQMWDENLEYLGQMIGEDSTFILSDERLQFAFNLSAGGAFALREIPYLRGQVNEEALTELLEEPPFPGQVISNDEYQCSETRIHHLTHLMFAQEVMEVPISTLQTTVEFGGGYGSMASLMRKINPNGTHIIVDLPEMNLVQTFFLNNAFESNSVNLVSEANPEIATGKINLVAVDNDKILCGLNGKVDLFLATYSLSEANEFTMDLFEKEYRFLEADYVFYEYRKYANINPRQPQSRELMLTADYSTVFHGASFWTYANENYYQVARRKIDGTE